MKYKPFFDTPCELVGTPSMQGTLDLPTSLCFASLDPLQTSCAAKPERAACTATGEALKRGLKVVQHVAEAFQNRKNKSIT